LSALEKKYEYKIAETIESRSADWFPKTKTGGFVIGDSDAETAAVDDARGAGSARSCWRACLRKGRRPVIPLVLPVLELVPEGIILASEGIG
jgi:hypothetical protein